jgi:hypothetical protein
LIDEGADADDGLHVALGRMREKRPTGEQLAALSLSLGIAASPALTASTAKATGVKTVSAVLKWLATAVAVGGGVTAILLVHRAPSSHRRAAAPISAVEERAATKELSRDETHAHADGTSRAAEAATPGTPAVSPSGVETQPTAAAAASNGKASPTATSDIVKRAGSSDSTPISTSSSPQHLSHKSDSHSTPAPSAKSAVDSSAAQSETALLNDARGVLGRDPAAALRLTERHRREYPSGVFVQEREVIAITALMRLGRTNEARSHAEAFEHAYPRSAYNRQIDRLLGAP